MNTPPDFKSLQEEVQKALVSVVKSTNRIAAEDLTFQRTINPDAAEQLDEKSARILQLSTKLLQSAARACGIKAPKLEDVEDVEMRWQSVVDVVDSVLEKADTALDEYTGLVKRKEPSTTETGPNAKRPKSTAKVIRNANVVKPQLSFDTKPDNFPSAPWKPLLTTKPHATIPLTESLVTFVDDNGHEQYKHPYDAEIKNMSYPDRAFAIADPIPSQRVDTTRATWVDTFDGVLEMLEHLKEAKEIAVDLEHHDFRTYTGLVSLMQISTRDKDWIVDTLQPWRQKLEVLNQVFADPSIIKVFHGAYMDMVWLQRDLGLYVNGLFDTFFACELLYSGRSLAFLLSKFVNFDADKQYQLADWRIRPIPAEMLYYARSDTHYLLYIYDCVRNDLLDASDRTSPEHDYINKALERSRDLSLSRHVHADYNEDTGEGPRGWYNYILKHSHLGYNGEQFAIFRAIWKWRDITARTEDESPNFVLGTTNVADISRINPPDAKALHSLIPMTAPLARARVNAIWGYMQEARAKTCPSMLQFFAAQAPEGVSKTPYFKSARATATITPNLDSNVVVSRMPKSQLFGDMPISTIWDGTVQPVATEEDQIPFPWQRFVSSLEEAEETDDQPRQEASQELSTQPAIPSAPTQPEAEEEFTLKRGKQRTSDSIDKQDSDSDSEESDSESDQNMVTDEASNGGVIEVDDEALQAQKEALIKQERKRQKRERRAEAEQRRQARSERKQQTKEVKKEQQQKKYEAVPFDYGQAASVMNANRAGPPKDGVKKKQKKAFNPYAKSSDDGAIKGARKPMPIRGERSATFKK